MGVKGLLPFLKSISKTVTLSDLRGCTVAVDTYCWLHKAAICCSDKIALSQDTDLYLSYCLKYINLLLSYNIKVILVFDGKNLPAKKDVEEKRRENRNINMKKAVQLVLENKMSEAKMYFDRCINISHDIAVKLIKKAMSLNVKCIVAPYEADAQLAFLGKNNIVDYIITDDSDLLLFGAPKVLFKLDFNGNGVLIEKKDLNRVIGMSLERYSFDKFRYICIISGCDYYSGIPGIGLLTATKMVKKTQLTEFSEFLRRINLYSTNKIILTQDEIQLALQAEMTLKYQIVFDPIRMKQVPLTEYPIGTKPSDFVFAGQAIEDSLLAAELACGKRSPTTQDIMPNYDWDTILMKKEHTFHYGLIKHKVNKIGPDRRKTIDIGLNRSKSMVVRFASPWKNVSKSNELLMNDIIESYASDHEEEVVESCQSLCEEETQSDDEAVNILKMVLDKDETIVTDSTINEGHSNPFSKPSVVRKRKIVDKENDIMVENTGGIVVGQDSGIIGLFKDVNKRKISIETGEINDVHLTSAKMIGRSRLGHLFKR